MGGRVLLELVGILTLCVSKKCWAQGFDPYSPGVHSTLRTHLNATTFPGLEANLDVWSPVEVGTYPVIYFLDSFGAVTPGDYYDLVLDRIASHGLVVVLPWKVAFGDPVNKLPVFQSVLDWNEQNLVELLIESGASPDLDVDFNTSIALGHSAGSHILCSYLREVGCGPFKGLALLSPVDGVDPAGIIDSFCIHEGDVMNFVTPTLVMPAGLDDVPGGLSTNISCAPAEYSNRWFYDALDPTTPRWLLNATDFGHVDFMDPLFQEIVSASHFCSVNEDAGLLAMSNYRSYVAGQVVSFVKGLISEDCTPYFPFLEDSSLMPVNVDVERVSAIGGSCPGAFCNWSPQI